MILPVLRRAHKNEKPDYYYFCRIYNYRFGSLSGLISGQRDRSSLEDHPWPGRPEKSDKTAGMVFKVADTYSEGL